MPTDWTAPDCSVSRSSAPRSVPASGGVGKATAELAPVVGLSIWNAPVWLEYVTFAPVAPAVVSAVWIASATCEKLVAADKSTEESVCGVLSMEMTIAPLVTACNTAILPVYFAPRSHAPTASPLYRAKKILSGRLVVFT